MRRSQLPGRAALEISKELVAARFPAALPFSLPAAAVWLPPCMGVKAWQWRS